MLRANLEEWFTVDEIAAHLKVSRSNVYQLIERGRLTAHRIGVGRGAIRIAQADLDEYLVSTRQLPAADLTTPSRAARFSKDPGVFKHLDVSRALGSRKPPKPR